MLQPQVTILNRYQLQYLLRRGGMSEVYLAFDLEMQREVAIKLVPGDDSDCFKRLKREVRVLSALAHPHILPTWNHGECDGWYYLVMPYMSQGTLRERLAGRLLTPEEAGQMLEQVAGALQFAHEHGIVHRDIKPSNILLDGEYGESFYLADFGLAKAIEEGSDITQTGCLVGTPEYMAPELTEKPESASSDIYALGIVLYQALTGQLPFRGSTPLSICWKHLHLPPAPPSQLNPAIPYAVEQVILRALEKDPRRRFQTAREMARAYQRALTLGEVPTDDGLDAVAENLAPVHVEVRKTSEIYPPVAFKMPEGLERLRRASREHRPGKVRMGCIACMAVLMLLVTPLTLGIMLGRNGITAPIVAGASDGFGAAALQPVRPFSPTASPTPTPAPVKTSTPTAHGPTGAPGQPPEPPEQHHPKGPGHGHGHGHKHGHADH
ncbi:MAG TPA: serine/threonine-protein kinase [Ktedonobacteraceae bacterium]|nr:serine/threonine-protein kinase [Ktedonobacteraceae bacterium]